MASNPFNTERIAYAKYHKTIEKQLLPLFRKALTDNMQPVLNWVESYGVENVPVDTLINTGVWRVVYPKAFELIGMKSARKEYYWQRSQEPTETKASAIDLLVDVWGRILRDYALTYTYQIERDLNDTTTRLIKDALGEDYSLELDRLGKVRLFFKNVGNIIKDRSMTFSRTEATTIANLGKDVGARSWIEQQGGQGYKMWLGRVVGERPEHLDLNNDIIEIDDLYDMAGHDCVRPGDVTLPPNLRINCRCSQSLMSENRYSQYVKRGLIVGGKVIG